MTHIEAPLVESPTQMDHAMETQKAPRVIERPSELLTQPSGGDRVSSCASLTRTLASSPDVHNPFPHPFLGNAIPAKARPGRKTPGSRPLVQERVGSEPTSGAKPLPKARAKKPELHRETRNLARAYPSKEGGG